MNVLVPVTWIFPVAPEVVIPRGDLIPSVLPEARVKVPPPVTTVLASAIWRNAPELTVQLMVLDTVPPEVKI